METQTAARATADFQVFVKPVGSLCNLNCHYCYYLEKASLYPDATSLQMPDDLLENYIIQQIDIAPEPTVNFFWHGGEPTLPGLDYFRRIVALQRKHCPPGIRITNGIQTNGLLLDEAWCRFLAAEGFSVGISIDGPQPLHDVYRLTRDGKPSHRQALQGYRLLRRHGVPVDILCVVHDVNVREPAAVYRFFKEIKAQYLSFIPLVEPEPGTPGGVSARTVPAEAFGAFLGTIFGEWVRQDIGQVVVQIFEEAARPLYGQDHSLCIFRKTCGDVPVIEHNGDFYCCDHFVTDAHRLGNILTTPLLALLESPAQRAFGLEKSAKLPLYCRQCEFLAFCYGGCPKDRIIRTADGEPGLNYLCAGYRRFFRESRPLLLEMAALRLAGQPPEALMQRLRDAERGTQPQLGRNDPCPCGSGKKYKKCCLRS
jgi:uncharacterized protein